MPIFPSGYPEKTSNSDEDRFLISDSIDSNKIKGTKWSTIKSSIKSYVEGFTDWITTAMLQDESVTSDKIDLATLNYKRRLGEDITTSNFLITTDWTTRRSVTVTTTTGVVEVNYGFLFGNAGSGATRSFDLRDRVDGIAANTRSFYLVNTSTLDANLGSVNIVRRYEGLANGTHTFDFQLTTNAASAVRVRDEFLTVDELY